MHRWHAPRLVRSARHGVAVNTGWGKSPGRARLHIPGGGRRGSMPTSLAPLGHQRANVNLGCVFKCWVFSSVLATLGRVSHIPRCVSGFVPFMGSLQQAISRLSLLAQFTSPRQRRAEHAAKQGVHGAINHTVPNSALVPQIQPFRDPPPPATCRRCRWRTNFPL